MDAFQQTHEISRPLNLKHDSYFMSFEVDIGRSKRWYTNHYNQLELDDKSANFRTYEEMYFSWLKSKGDINGHTFCDCNVINDHYFILDAILDPFQNERIRVKIMNQNYVRMSIIIWNNLECLHMDFSSTLKMQKYLISIAHRLKENKLTINLYTKKLNEKTKYAFDFGRKKYLNPYVNEPLKIAMGIMNVTGRINYLKFTKFIYNIKS